MSDGTVLRANVFLPGDGSGRYPGVMTVTGYNKDVAHPSGTGCGAGDGITGVNPAMLAKGYALIVVDDRGTGASGGSWDSWGERTQADYPEVLDWLAKQPWFDGSAAMYGASYMGITSLLVAEADAARVKAGKPRVIKAVYANVPMADAYRDVTFHGGAIDAGFIPLWLGLTTALSDIPPSTLVTDPAGALPTYAGHLAGNFAFAAQSAAGAALNTEQAYDGAFYRLRSPVSRIEELTIPVAWTGGWWDIFQRGEPLLYERMVNSPKRKFWMAPNYHSAPAADIYAKQGIGTETEVAIKWFDKWLRGRDNGVEKLPPVNLYTMGADRWETPADWPLPNTRYTSYFAGDGGALSATAPTTEGSDDLPLLPVSSPCSRLTAQWTAGLAALGNCETDAASFESTGVTFTTPALERDTEVTGLITVDIWATLTAAADATFVAVLSDVAPDGTSTQLTAGFLLASQRANDRARSTLAPDGTVVRPWHPFTRESQRAVPAGEPQEYLIEVYPTSNVFRAGHRIRLTIQSANTPSTLTPVPDSLNSLGSAAILHGGGHASRVVLPLADGTAKAQIGTAAVTRCPARTVTVTLPRGLRSAKVTQGRKVLKVRHGKRWTVRVAVGRANVKLRIVGRTKGGRHITQSRVLKACVRR